MAIDFELICSAQRNTIHIQILLSEYSSLRDEKIQRGSWQIQICTVGGTATVAIFGFMFIYQAIYTGIFLLFLTVALVTVGLSYNDQDVRVIATRVRFLEGRINELAGEELLAWETKSGILGRGYIERLRQLFFHKS